MAKNFVEEGKTIPVVNGGSKVILSGQLVSVGNIVAVAITDIEPGETGDGLAEGVFQFSKSGLALAVGAAVFVKDGVAQADAAGAVYAGVAWESALSGDSYVNVKINTGFVPAAAANGS